MFITFTELPEELYEIPIPRILPLQPNRVADPNRRIHYSFCLRRGVARRGLLVLLIYCFDYAILHRKD